MTDDSRAANEPPEEMADAIGRILISGDNGGIWIASSSDYPVWRYEFASAIDGLLVNWHTQTMAPQIR